MRVDRRGFLAAAAAASTGFSARSAIAASSALTPEQFGARGDGVTNDTHAFSALSAEVNRRGGGTIALAAGKTYRVGEQRAGGEMGWSPAPVIDVRSLTTPLRLIGNGARMRCMPGLRFGTFDRITGQIVRRKMPNYRAEEAAAPYMAMIRIRDCRAPVEVRDVELDGNVQRLRIGGPFGDTGWQVPGTGLWLVDNHSSETISNVFTHHHPLDGALLDADDHRVERSRIERLVARYNGRQGASITGGRGYDFEDCEFSFSGRSAVTSAPAAGVDIEAEGEKIVRDLTFTRCKFLDNSGVGLVADAGDSAGARFEDCLFVGSKAWSAWPNKPGFLFRNCRFAGAIVNAFASSDPELAAKFLGCRFVDDPGLSAVGTLYFLDGPSGPCANLGKSLNVLFDACSFDLNHQGLLPWSWSATYRNCTMAQKSTKTAFTKGKYLGRTTIDAPVDLYGSMIIGTVILNGREVPRGPVGADVRPW